MKTNVKKIINLIFFILVIFIMINLVFVEKKTVKTTSGITKTFYAEPQGSSIATTQLFFVVPTGTISSNNGKRMVLAIWQNPDGRVVVLWEAAKNGFQAEQSLTINGEEYTANEIATPCEKFYIYDENGQLLKSYTDNRYYMAQVLHSTQVLDENFGLRITTSASGHSLGASDGTELGFEVTYESNALKVRNNYSIPGNNPKGELDLKQTVNGATPGNTYNINSTPKKGFKFNRAEITYPDGHTETVYMQNINLLLEAGITEVIFYYDVGYTIEYYYNGVIDNSKTEKVTATYGDIITDFPPKQYGAYELDHTENLPLTLNEDADTTIKVFYMANPTIDINISGTDIMDSNKSKFEYTLTQHSDVPEGYNNQSNVLITCKLPYEIDLTKPYNFNGGTYDNTTKTITWNENVNSHEIDLEKTISGYFKNFDYNDNDIFEVQANAKLTATQNGTSSNFTATDTCETKLRPKMKITATISWQGDEDIPESVNIILNKKFNSGYLQVYDEQKNLNESNNWHCEWNDVIGYDVDPSLESYDPEKISFDIVSLFLATYYNMSVDVEKISLGDAKEDGTIADRDEINFYIKYSTFGELVITNVDRNDESIILTGGTFILKKYIEIDGNYVVDTNFIEREITIPESGSVTIDKISNGKYILEQTKAPNGYELAVTPQELIASGGNNTNNFVFKNTKKVILPETGGNGNTIILGIVCILIALELERRYRFVSKTTLKISRITKSNSTHKRKKVQKKGKNRIR